MLGIEDIMANKAQVGVNRHHRSKYINKQIENKQGNYRACTL